MLTSLFFTSESSSAGRCDANSLSDQTLIELLFANVKDVERLRDFTGDFLDVRKISGLECTMDGFVTAISFNEMDIGEQAESDEEDLCLSVGPMYTPGLLPNDGSIDLKWIPSSVGHFEFRGFGISGSIETRNLPRGLHSFDISWNAIEGTFDTASLPADIRHVDVACNRITGPLDLSALPHAVVFLDVHSNSLTGTLELTHLPDVFLRFDLSENAFSGQLNILVVPRKFKKLNLAGNNFSYETLTIGKIGETAGIIQLDQGHAGTIVDANGKQFDHPLIVFCGDSESEKI